MEQEPWQSMTSRTDRFLSTQLQVECAKKLSRDYPVGTQFRIRAKLTDREGKGEYLYSSFRWPVVVIPANR